MGERIVQLFYFDFNPSSYFKGREGSITCNNGCNNNTHSSFPINLLLQKYRKNVVAINDKFFRHLELCGQVRCSLGLYIHNCYLLS